MIAALALLTCAATAAPEVTITYPEEEAVQFALRRGELVIAGLSVFVREGDDHGLLALTPMGVELFHVRIATDEVVVDGPSEWTSTLQRLPWRRDVGLLHLWSCAETRCRAPGGRVRQRQRDGVTEIRWRGRGGPAVVEHTPGRAVLRDRRRGYSLEIVSGGAP